MSGGFRSLFAFWTGGYGKRQVAQQTQQHGGVPWWWVQLNQLGPGVRAPGADEWLGWTSKPVTVSCGAHIRVAVTHLGLESAPVTISAGSSASQEPEAIAARIVVTVAGLGVESAPVVIAAAASVRLAPVTLVASADPARVSAGASLRPGALTLVTFADPVRITAGSTFRPRPVLMEAALTAGAVHTIRKFDPVLIDNDLMLLLAAAA